ncbi:MAG: hypothetical protein Q7R43_05235 [Candidatus Daviesbacteria bacterium]|nr:hypothetical protein [Candidatus Daviesbacteria bacterium]
MNQEKKWPCLEPSFDFESSSSLESFQPPIFPRIWNDRFEAEFSHNDPEICVPPGCTSRLKQSFNLIEEEMAQCYCPFCKTLFAVNVRSLRFILGAKSQNNHELIIPVLKQ